MSFLVIFYCPNIGESAATTWYTMHQNLRGMFPAPCWIYATKN